LVERIRITPTQMITRDASNNVLFDSNVLFVKQGGGSIYLEGYKNFPVAYGGDFVSGIRYSPVAGGFLVWSANLFGRTPMNAERWIPRPTQLDIVTAPYLAYLTIHRYFVSPYFQTTISGTTIGNVRWVGACGYDFIGNPSVYLYPEFSFTTGTFYAGYWIIPWSNYVNFTYTDNGALYQAEYGSVPSFKFAFDLYISATSRAASYSGTP
jgi:hypothetical protein